MWACERAGVWVCAGAHTHTHTRRVPHHRMVAAAGTTRRAPARRWHTRTHRLAVARARTRTPPPRHSITRHTGAAIARWVFSDRVASTQHSMVVIDRARDDVAVGGKVRSGVCGPRTGVAHDALVCGLKRLAVMPRAVGCALGHGTHLAFECAVRRQTFVRPSHMLRAVW